MFFSKLQFHSMISMDFSDLFTITKSGLRLVTTMSAGIVPPFKVLLGMSAQISRFFVLYASIALVKWLIKESCLYLKRPSFSDTNTDKAKLKLVCEATALLLFFHNLINTLLGYPQQQNVPHFPCP